MLLGLEIRCEVGLVDSQNAFGTARTYFLRNGISNLANLFLPESRGVIEQVQHFIREITVCVQIYLQQKNIN